MRPLLLFVLVAGSFDRPARVPSAPFEVPRPGQVLVGVRLNGAGPFELLVDTGSSHTAVSNEVAAALLAPTVARTVVTSPLGRTIRPVVRLDRVTVGPLSASGVLASVVERKAMDPSGRIRGLIGQDVLASWRFTLDYRRRRLEWHHEGSLPAGVDALTLRAEAERLFVEIPGSTGVMRLVPDSATEALVLFQRRGRALPAAVRRDGRAELTTFGEQQSVSRVRVLELRVGRRTFFDLPAVVVHRDSAAEEEGDGLLPLHLFARVTFDGPGRRLFLSR
jgi:hypothetical protein